ncbi:tRNA lysidine(34) synthetase TilS [Albidovulum sp.]
MLQTIAAALDGAPPGAVGVAVSGGGDSLALLHLLFGVLSGRGAALRAVTVDHRLRPESAAEAQAVAALCGRLGIAHDILVWANPDGAGNLQDRARRARYRLIGDWARRHGLAVVALGHTADDQAETVLMGLARGAGLDGLTGMRRRWMAEGITWIRPLLDRGRAELRAYLAGQGLDWAEDPSNADGRFTRVRARRALAALAPLGITAARLARVADNLVTAQQALRRMTAETVARIARAEAGEIVIDRRAFAGLPTELRRRVLIGALRWLSGAEHPPREESLRRVLSAIAEGRDAPLSGCQIRIRGETIRIGREPRAVAALETASDAVWDHRWRLAGPHRPGLTIRALGAGGLSRCPRWRQTGHARETLIVSPAVWSGDRLVAAPLAGLANGWQAQIVADDQSFPLSH